MVILSKKVMEVNKIIQWSTLWECLGKGKMKEHDSFFNQDLFPL